MNFTLTKEQNQKLKEWLKDVNVRAVTKQKEEFKDPTDFIKMCWDENVPYCGTIGGNLTYSFTPTGLGNVVKVTESISGEEVDLTEYDMW